ncbi:MAG: hypothetical protein ACLQU2_08420 [Candidatus Binataceae bacterium]
MASHFRIRNFERFQHYKDRNPPWIKLYGALWRDRAFFRLPDAAKAHLIGLFTLAARLENRIPDDPEWLAHELCASEPIDLGALAASGFLIREHQASPPNAASERPAPVSVSDSDLILRQTAINKGIPHTQANPSGASDPAEQPKVCNSVVDPGQNQRRKGKRAETMWPLGFVLDDEMRQFAFELGIDPVSEFQAWRDDCAAHDRRYADWRAAWRGRCRNALRFAGRAGARSRASPGPGESSMDVALRRLREASQREGWGSAS